MKRFLALLSFFMAVCQASGVFESRVLNFEEIDQRILFQKTEVAKKSPTKSSEDFLLNPKSTIMFIDLDDTFLNHDGRDRGTQTLKHPDNLMYLKRWKDAGFYIVFLTSRDESEQEITMRNLKTVGVKDEWQIPLFITGSGSKKGEWLAAHQADFLKKFTTIIHIDDKKHQLDSMKNTVCSGRACYLVHFDQQSNVELGDASIPLDITRFTQQQTETGGNQATFILKEGGNPLYVLKKDLKGDGTSRTEQFKEEVLADAIYDVIGKAEPSFGIHVPKFKVIMKNGVYERISEFLPGQELGFRNQDEVAKGFVVDAFMANWDLVVGGKNLWFSNNTVYRMDNGGSLRYRAIGELKSTTGYDFSSAKCDLETLRGKNCQNLTINNDGTKFYGRLSEQDILKQIEKFVPLQGEVLKVADQYNNALHITKYGEFRSNLITRFNSLKEYYYDHPQVLTRYERSHPFRMNIPGQSSASVLIYAIDPNDGRPKILLGKRVGHDWWGNFGGKADDTDETLLNAAVREVKEESMGEYVFLKEDLLKAPSHDLIKDSQNPDRLHRMYLVKGEYKDPKSFKDKLKEQTDEHLKEYTDFAWVDVADVLHLVEQNLTSANSTNETQYKVRSKNGDVDPSVVELGAASAASREGNTSQIFVHHPLMDMLRQEPVMNWLKAIVKKEPPKLVNTQGSMGIASRNFERYLAPVFFDPRSERLQKLYHTTTKHMDVLTELKNGQPQLKPADLSMSKNENLKKEVEKIRQQKDVVHNEPVINLPERTATDAYLEFILGSSYVPFNPQENVYKFFKNHSSLAKSYVDEFSEKSPSCDVASSYKCTVLKAMDKERKMKDWFVLYHTLPGKLGFLYDVFTEFRNVLRVKGSDSIHSLRAFDKFFKDLENVEKFLADEYKKQNLTSFNDMNNYKGTFQEKGLSTNITLFGSKDVDTSSTFHMLHDDQTVSPPNYERLLGALLSEFGIIDTKKYFDLFERYFGKTKSTTIGAETIETGENHLLQIFINPMVIDDVVYLAGNVGKGLFSTFEEQKQKLLPSAFLKELRKDPSGAHDKLQVSEITNKNGGGGLHRIQARLFMKPEVMSDPNKVQIIRYTKTKIQERYFQELKEMVRHDLSNWLKQHYELQGDTLENPSQEGVSGALPPLQKVYRHLDQSEGITYQTKTPEELYGRFLMDDNVEGIKQILARNPKFDLFKQIPNPDYRQSGGAKINPFDIMLAKKNIFIYLKEKMRESFKKQFGRDAIDSISILKQAGVDIDGSHILSFMGTGLTVEKTKDLVEPISILIEAGVKIKGSDISSLIENGLTVEKAEAVQEPIRILKQVGVNIFGTDMAILIKKGLTVDHAKTITILKQAGVEIDGRDILSLIENGLTVEKAEAVQEPIRILKQVGVNIFATDVEIFIKEGLTVEKAKDLVEPISILKQSGIYIEGSYIPDLIENGLTIDHAKAISILKEAGADIYVYYIPVLIKNRLTVEEAQTMKKPIQILKQAGVEIDGRDIPSFMRTGLTVEKAKDLVEPISILIEAGVKIDGSHIPGLMQKGLTVDHAKAILILRQAGVEIDGRYIPDLIQNRLTVEKAKNLVEPISILIEAGVKIDGSHIPGLMQNGLTVDHAKTISILKEAGADIYAYYIPVLIRNRLTVEEAETIKEPIQILKQAGVKIDGSHIPSLMQNGLLTVDHAKAISILKQAGVEIRGSHILSLMQTGLTVEKAKDLVESISILKQEMVDITGSDIPSFIKAGLTTEHASAIQILRKQEKVDLYIKSSDIPDLIAAGLTVEKAKGLLEENPYGLFLDQIINMLQQEHR